MSNALKIGKSGLIYESQIESAKTYCINNYGPEWDLDVKEVRILDVPFYQGRCIHKKYSANINQCCDGFLINDNMFGLTGALGPSKVICPLESGNILTCNGTNRKDLCYDQILSGSVDKYCSSFITKPGNNFELLKTTLINSFISDYKENNGKYVKYKNFIDNFGKLSIVVNLDNIVKDAFNLNVTQAELLMKQKMLDEKDKLIKQKDDDLLTKQKLLEEQTIALNQKIISFNIKDKELANIQSILNAKQSDYDKILGALSALEQQQQSMKATLDEKNALIKNVQKNIDETALKLQSYIQQRDKANNDLNDIKVKTDLEIKQAQENYNKKLTELKQQELDARTKLESDLAAQKKKDMDELTKVYNSRETELQKNFAVLQQSYDKANADNKAATQKLMDDLTTQKLLSEQTIANFNKQIIDKQNELTTIKKQNDDAIYKIQQDSITSINKIKSDNTIASTQLIKTLQEEKEKSLKNITDVYNAREKEVNDKLIYLQTQMSKADQDNKIKIQTLMTDYEKKKTEYENTLITEYKKKDDDYRKMATTRELEYQTALTKLQNDNKKQTDQLNAQFKQDLETINIQKISMQKQFDDFKKQSESDFALLTTKLNQERALYNNEIIKLNNLIKMKEDDAKQKILNIQISLENDLKNLSANQELKKTLLLEQTEITITKALEELNSKKTTINKEFDDQLKKTQSDLDTALLSQKNDYAKKITTLQESNNQMVSNLEAIAKTYKMAQEEQNKNLQVLTETKQKEYIKIQEEYNLKAKLEEDKFKQIVKTMEDNKFETIKKFTQETDKELSRLNLIVDEQRKQNQIESDKKRVELTEVITKLENDKIQLVNQKNAETKQALDNIQKIYDKQAEEIKNKINEYNNVRDQYNKKVTDEMTLFEKQMSILEEQKLKRVSQYTIQTQEEIAIIGKSLEEQKKKSIEDGIKYRKVLEETIEELDKERMNIIKKKNDETAQILNKIQQEYEVEVLTVNKSIQEYNNKKKDYDNKIKNIDEEQTIYVAKKRAESEQELGKLSQMLSDEINDLKNKIESYKVQRNEKINEINKLNKQLVELQNKNIMEASQKLILNQYILWGLIITIVILLIIVFLQYIR